MGREPTSGSCHTCRRRRVRCDKSKPICHRCQKAGFDCQGYGQVLRIQSHGVVQCAEPPTSRLEQIHKSDSYPKHSTHGTRSTLAEYRTEQRSLASKSSSSSTGSDARHPPTLIPILGPTLSAFKDNICFTYFFHSYSWINVHSILLQDTPMRQHLALQTDELGLKSLRALAYGLFSRDHSIDALRHSAAQIYGSTLQALQHKLATARKREMAHLIKPIAILGSYSISVDHDFRFTHHHGLASILEHCGPESFQDAAMLPIFESCRMTLVGHNLSPITLDVPICWLLPMNTLTQEQVASAIVRRRGTFLQMERWRTIPWAVSPGRRTNTSILLDIVARVPGIIQGADDVLNERVERLAVGSGNLRKETPSTVPDLRLQLESIYTDLTRWRLQWELGNGSTASTVLEWALFRVKDDSYRPGIYGAQGPDVYAHNMVDASNLNLSSGAVPGLQPPAPSAANFSLMQDAALYITALIWCDRLNKNLTGAIRDFESIDFYNAPFYTRCRCYYDHPGPSRLCQIFPRQSDSVDPCVSWNLNSLRVSETPTRLLTRTSLAVNSEASVSHYGKFHSHGGALDGSLASMSSEVVVQNGEVLLPGDVRFSAQLRILSWLVRHLTSSRAYVLGTLAAMGLSHCVHDVRPSEGNELIANTIRSSMARSGFEGAADLLIRAYR